MNFKSILVLLVLTSCGLKTRPSPPAGTKTPSIESKYIKKYNLKKEQKKKEEKK